MKILVEKAVIEQALKALEFAYRNIDEGGDVIYKAITALREALAEPELNLNCKSVQKRLATVWGYVKAEQAEQEPVAVVEITYGREPECYVTGNIDDFPEGVFKLYAAPVRTKDLTDDEILILNQSTPLRFARAVLAKFKEKNR